MIIKLRSIFGLWRANADIGRLGEERAVNFLKTRKGMQILARNWRSPDDLRDELDIVCQDGPVLVIVEVKTRHRDALVRGYYTVNRRKKTALKRAVWAYLRGLRQGTRPKTLRLDVVEVMHPWNEKDPGDGVIHLENIPFITHYRA